MSWFYEKKQESLRTELEGADTAIWLATSDDERITKRENNGKFWFDRSIVKENFPLHGLPTRKQKWMTCGTIVSKRFVILQAYEAKSNLEV